MACRTACRPFSKDLGEKTILESLRRDDGGVNSNEAGIGRPAVVGVWLLTGSADVGRDEGERGC